jgi:hypothetical protein
MKRTGAVTALALVVLALVATEARGAPDGWAWPVKGQVITPYSNDNARPYAGGMHRGIDIAAPVGARVVAARGGVVTFAGPLGYSGLTVAVRTDDGYATSYLHLAAVSVARGDRLASGDRIGAVGTTGRRSKPEPHLHFGVRLAGREHAYVDPLSLLPALHSAEPAPAPAPVPLAVPARRAPAPVRHPVARPVTIPLAQPARDWGQVVGLAGLILFLAALFGRGLVRALRDANRALRTRSAQPTKASASISTFQRGSRRPVTTTIVAAGRTSPNASA